MSNEIEFVSGLYYNDPHPNAPDFIKGKLSIQRDKLLQWLNAKQPNGSGYINAVIKVSKDGKPYIAVDAWEPKARRDSYQDSSQPQPPSQEDDSFDDSGDPIPF